MRRASRLTYETPTPAHVGFVAGQMREGDRAEVLAASGLTPLRALDVSVRASTFSATCLWHGEPVGIFGVVPVSTIDGVGAPWMLATDSVDDLAREWLVDAPQWLVLMADGYSVLRNWVDARNVRSRRWLKHMGFKMGAAEPHGVAGMAFHPFERRV